MTIDAGPRPRVFDHETVAAYLSAWLAWRCAVTGRRLSSRWLARRWTQEALSGRRVQKILGGRGLVPLDRVESLCEVLELSEEERSALAARVYAEHLDREAARVSGTDPVRRLFDERLRSLEHRVRRFEWLHGKSDTAYLSHPALPLIKEMLLLPDASPTADWVHRRSGGRISREMAADALDAVREVGVVDEEGGIRRSLLLGGQLVRARPEAGDDTQQVERIREHHLFALEMARSGDPAGHHRVDLWLDEHDYAALTARLHTLAQTVASGIADAGSLEVIQLGIQLLPAEEPA